MKAAIRRKYVSPKDLLIENIAKPSPKANEILVKIHATTVNRTDYAVMTGRPFIMRFFTGLFRPTFAIPGTDFAGIVEAIGSKVSQFKVGDKVMAFRDEGLPCQAEYIAIAATANIMKMPANIDFQQAAASLEGGHYAHNFMREVDLKAGQKAIVNGATGAIGSAILQFLKHEGLQVTAVCNTKNIELIKSLGADKIYDYLQEDFTQKEAQYGEQYDYVFDTVGKSTFGKCKPLMKKGGAYMSSELGPRAENPFLSISTKFFGEKRNIFPVPTDIKRSMNYIIKLLSEGKFKPVIDRTYPLEKIAEAYEYVNTGKKTGNVVIEM